MRKPIFCAILLFLFCCFAALRASVQQTYEYSDISYDDSTGTVYGYSSTDIDYSCSENYDAYVEGYLKNQNGTTLDSGYATHPYLAQVYTSASANPDDVYTETGYHNVIMRYYYDNVEKSPDGCMPCDGCNTDCYWYQEDYYWWDPYGFSTTGHTGNYGSWVSLFSNSPYVQVEDDEYIDLGQTSDSLATVGLPDHVKVVADQQGVPSICPNGLQVRYITVQIVDANNRNVTDLRNSVAEDLTDISTNSCGNGSPQSGSCSPVDPGGLFTDEMEVSRNVCNDPSISTPISRNSGCGYTLTSTWSWCRFSTKHDPIWRYYGETRSNNIKVDGGTRFDPGTYLYPPPREGP